MIDHVSYLILAHAAGATFTPDEALMVLNVLPKDRVPAAAMLGSLPVLDLLWRLAGPLTLARMVWHSNLHSGFIAHAIENDQVQALDWFSGVTSAANIPVQWESRRWELAACEGHTRSLMWTIERGYMTELDCEAALLSTQSGNTSVVDWWIAQQPSKEVAMAALNSVELVQSTRSTKSLDWWWANAHSGGLPHLNSFADIVNNMLFRGDMDSIEWWWARFLEHRTPEHTFGSKRTATEIARYRQFAVMEWLWDHSHASGNHYDPTAFPFFSPDWHGIPLQSIFSVYSPTSLPFLQWVVAKCAVLGQRL
ncbi:hypothetical protein BC828DRAFT_402874, partial [Blastocladiella britannica]